VAGAESPGVLAPTAALVAFTQSRAGRPTHANTGADVGFVAGAALGMVAAGRYNTRSRT
jgi:hypothetical protein